MSGNNQTITSKQGIIYSDIPNNFAKAPFSNDLAKVTNINAVKQSLKNIAKTILGERLYDNTIGRSSSDYAQFGLNDDLATSNIQHTLKDALALEPRATISQITVDTTSIANAMVITIYFSVINTGGTYSTAIILDRVR